MQTIRRTRERRIPLLLKAEHEDRGPYYLVDRAGYGVSWRKPAYEHVPTESRYPASYAGASHTRRLTWVPIFDRAKLAFTLVDDNEEVDAKLAKKIADKTYDKLGSGRPMGEVERYAYYLLKKAQKTAPSRDPKSPSKVRFFIEHNRYGSSYPWQLVMESPGSTPIRTSFRTKTDALASYRKTKARLHRDGFRTTLNAA
jgi:hypothetical protein